MVVEQVEGRRGERVREDEIGEREGVVWKRKENIKRVSEKGG